MALIVENIRIADGIYLLTLTGVPHGAPGQFVQVHMPDASMLLPRPISLFDSDKETGETRLAYRVTGKGTKLLSTLASGELRVTGPLGSGFSMEGGDAALIGGGLGIAPLAYLCRALRRNEPHRHIAVYLGFSGGVFLTDAFPDADEVITDVGGYITSKVDFARPGTTFYACGPEPMLRAAAKCADGADAKLFVSLERRMACGVGACFACSVATAHGNRRVCKDGPVFPAQEVYYE